MKAFTLIFDGSGTDQKTLPHGTFLRVDTASATLALTVWRAGSQLVDMPAASRGLSWESLDERGATLPFDEIRINSAAAQTVVVMVGKGRVSMNFSSVSLAQGTALTDAPAVAVVTGAVPTALVAAGSGRKGLRFYNAGSVDVYIGSSTVSVAAGAVKLAPGQLWLEDDAADAAWYGVHASAASQTVRVQVVS